MCILADPPAYRADPLSHVTHPFSLLLTAIGWTLLVLFSLWTQREQLNRTGQELARINAIANLKKDTAIRKWASEVGGVFIREDLAPNIDTLSEQERVIAIRPMTGESFILELRHNNYGIILDTINMNRRRFLSSACALTPIAAALSTLGACSKDAVWPEGMQPIKWDRDTCVRCNMVISDRRFAAEMRGGEKDTVFKFDDIGCLVFWLRDKAQQYPWIIEPATRLWVADYTGKGERWLNARTAQYLGGRVSPMGYNYAAVAYPQPGSVDFATLRQHVLAFGK